MRTRPRPAADVEPSARATRREEIAVAFFGTWMITGLFLDGWAHQAGMPESFFSPWHAVLYSGFGGAVLFFTWQRLRGRDAGGVSGDRLMTFGVALFVAGAVGDMIWHEIFGIEVGIEALLSPTHLLLMIGGLLMVGAPVRSAWRSTLPREPSLLQAGPAIVCVTLSVGLVGFFTMYASAFLVPVMWWDEAVQVHGIVSMLATTLLYTGAMLYLLRRWLPPLGSMTVLFSAVAVAMSSLGGFERGWLIIPAVVAGIVADAAVRALRPSAARLAQVRVVSGLVPLVFGGAYFAVFHAVWGVFWPPELWVGTIVLSGAAGVGLSVLVFPERVTEPERVSA